MTLRFSDLGVASPVQSAKAFVWIVDLLRQHEIPFLISGGLAARCYGATRPLADIDIGVKFSEAEDLFEDIKSFSAATIHYKDSEWDVPLHSFEYAGQVIDLFDTENCFIFDKTAKKWRRLEHDYSLAMMIGIDGVEVPVIDRKTLLSYKKMIDRDVDRADVSEVSALMNKDIRFSQPI